jgi:hypothetical protein
MFRIRDIQRNFGSLNFLVCFFVIWAVLMPVPTIEVFKLNRSMGRIPVYYSYVGFLTPEYWLVTIPIVVIHVVISYFLAVLVRAALRRSAPGNQQK